MLTKEDIIREKEYIANRINKNCFSSSCFVCAEADKYDDYTQCPYLELKQIGRERKITVDDIPDSLIKK